MGPGLSDPVPGPAWTRSAPSPPAPRHLRQPPRPLLLTQPGSQAEMRPVPVPSRVSRAQLELRLLKAARALLMSLSTGVGSAAFTGPIKHRAQPLQHTACLGHLALPRPGRTRFFFKELISQTHKITPNAVGVCVLKDNYRVTSPPWTLVGTEDSPKVPLTQRICPYRARHCANNHWEPIISQGPQNSPSKQTVSLVPNTEVATEAGSHTHGQVGRQS